MVNFFWNSTGVIALVETLPIDQRVAVRLGARHFLDGEDAEGARLVLDHERLAEDLS